MARSTSLTGAVLVCFFFATTPAFSQIQFKLQWMADSLAWGVFATPEQGTEPSDYLIIGSGQVTLVAPPGSQFGNLKSFSGIWEQNAYVGTPKENPEKDYISFGLVTADPPMEFRADEETLFFTFSSKSEDCPEELYLMPNDDPFNKMPNSVNSNPGNDISVLDPGNNKAVYFFSKIYSPGAWDCHPGKTVAQGPFHHGYDKRRQRRVNRP
ncbi:MAG: hypothetical protein HY842_00615 [Bacteroidetes bacterium]|nr:hypothetical protein [Bacteroidota bacterium]